MKTAVEWFEDELTLFYDDAYIQKLLKEVKEMEKWQIIDAHESGVGCIDYGYGIEYYNETFKSK